ncbi:hypothetical protein [Chryseolinea lacunae]|uniref:TerB family tellurite resistance protein n=1 Tax=Chryseolinea lacunae TaxID=2801331 RepID=A0ABS1L1Q1_9BACT|nr:hypothetical protein [Chryseolinea lacunae]MBL0744862.1 hypothetical protein [Chryseolinea lacunae]
MKKISAVVILLLLLASSARSQDAPTFNEWFSQKKTQIKYLVQQIAALKVYLGYLKQGYEIVDKGLTTIGDIKGGSLLQDKTYLNSLKTVNPLVSHAPQVKVIVMYQESIIRLFDKLQIQVADSDYFTEAEIKYMQDVHQGMLTECHDAIDELTLILTAGQAEMKDDERLLHLDKIYEEMADNYTFTKCFVSSTQLLANQRAKERHQVRSSEKIILEM